MKSKTNLRLILAQAAGRIRIEFLTLCALCTVFYVGTRLMWLGLTLTVMFAGAALVFLPKIKRNVFILTLLAGVASFVVFQLKTQPFSPQNRTRSRKAIDHTVSGLSQLKGGNLIRVIDLDTGEKFRCRFDKKLQYDQVEDNFRWVYGTRAVVSGSESAGDRLLAINRDTGEEFYSEYHRPEIFFQVDQFEITGKNEGFWSWVGELRDHILGYSLEGVEDANTRQLQAALFFGIRPGLEGESRTEFIRSGIIHLLAVSGLHVGMLAAMLLLIMRPVPWRMRYLIMLVILAIYVITTGANPPAMRALLMISFYSLLKISLYYLRPTGILAVTAIILLICNPGNFANLGFWYSFIITGGLLILSEGGARLKMLLYSENAFFPSNKFKEANRKLIRRQNAVAMAIASCLIAFLAGLPVSLYFQGLLAPAAVVGNLLLLPLVGLLFPLLGIKIALSFLGITWSVVPLAWVLKSIMFIGEWTAKFFDPWPAARTGLLLVLVFYAGALLLIFGRSRITRIIGLVALCGTLSFWVIQPYFASPALVIIHSGELRVPVVLIADAKAQTAIMVNAPYGSAAFADRYFTSRGIKNITELHFTAGKSANSGGVAALNRLLPVKKIQLPAGRMSAVFKSHLSELPNVELQSRSNLKLEATSQVEGSFALHYDNPATGLILTIEYQNTDNPLWRIDYNGTNESIVTFRRSVGEIIER